MEYQNKYILWLDILGFKTYVEKSISEPHLLQIISDSIDAPQDFEPGLLDLLNIGDITLAEHQISSFSDTIVVSTEPSIRGFLYLANYYIKIFSKLEKEGLFSRGSLTYGQIFHTGNKFFGPGVIEAYSLEKKAQYPRIIIAQNVINMINEYTNEHKSFIYRFIQFEDVPYLHALFRYRNFRNENTNIVVKRICLEFYNKINLNIIACMKLKDKKEKEKCIEKYRWLSNYFKRITGFENRELENIVSSKINAYEFDIFDYSKPEI